MYVLDSFQMSCAPRYHVIKFHVFSFNKKILISYSLSFHLNDMKIVYFIF